MNSRARTLTRIAHDKEYAFDEETPLVYENTEGLLSALAWTSFAAIFA